MTYDVLPLRHRVWNRQVEHGMHKFALRSVGAKSAKILDAHHAPCVSIATEWAVPAEPSVIPGAISNFRFRIYMQKWTLLVTTCVETRVEVAFRHFRHVKLVKEFALVPLLAKTPQPVFTYHGSVALNMPKRTCGSFAAAALQIETAHGCSRLVHAGERQWQRAELSIQGHLQLEDNVSYFGYYLFHCSRSLGGPLDSATSVR